MAKQVYRQPTTTLPGGPRRFSRPKPGFAPSGKPFHAGVDSGRRLPTNKPAAASSSSPGSGGTPFGFLPPQEHIKFVGEGITPQYATDYTDWYNHILLPLSNAGFSINEIPALGTDMAQALIRYVGSVDDANIVDLLRTKPLSTIMDYIDRLIGPAGGDPTGGAGAGEAAGAFGSLEDVLADPSFQAFLAALGGAGGSAVPPPAEESPDESTFGGSLLPAYFQNQYGFGEGGG